jgi:protein-S-isoprenylcysteine O-methyltransferase Ste14
VVGVFTGAGDPRAGSGCFVAESIAPYLPSLLATYGAIQGGFFVVALSRRIKREEEMLHEAFGREWEDYHRATRRLIPRVY